MLCAELWSRGSPGEQSSLRAWTSCGSYFLTVSSLMANTKERDLTWRGRFSWTLENSLSLLFVACWSFSEWFYQPSKLKSHRMRSFCELGRVRLLTISHNSIVTSLICCFGWQICVLKKRSSNTQLYRHSDKSWIDLVVVTRRRRARHEDSTSACCFKYLFSSPTAGLWRGGKGGLHQPQPLENCWGLITSLMDFFFFFNWALNLSYCSVAPSQWASTVFVITEG